MWVCVTTNTNIHTSEASAMAANAFTALAPSNRTACAKMSKAIKLAWLGGKHSGSCFSLIWSKSFASKGFDYYNDFLAHLCYCPQQQQPFLRISLQALQSWHSLLCLDHVMHAP